MEAARRIQFQINYHKKEMQKKAKKFKLFFMRLKNLKPSGERRSEGGRFVVAKRTKGN